MARLRKPSTLEAPVFMPPSSTSKPARTSPRKTNNSTVHETPSRRELRYSSTIALDEEESILIPKMPTSGATPKQRIRALRPVASIQALQPVASNSRLLRRLSDESIRSPEKRAPRERSRAKSRAEGSGVGFNYAKDLARLVGRKGAKIGKVVKSGSIEARIETEKEANRIARKVEQLDMNEEQVEVEIEETLAEEEEVDQSLWCGDEEDDAVQEAVADETGKDVNEEAIPEEQVELESEEEEVEDEDGPVVNVRSRQRQGQRQIVESDPESEDEDVAVIVKSRSRQVPLRVEAKAVESSPNSEVEDPAVVVTSRHSPLRAEAKAVQPELEPLTSSRPAFRKGHSAISIWAQEVIDLTSSPEPTASFAVPDLPPPRGRPVTCAKSSRPTSSASIDVDALLNFSPTPKKQRSPRKAPPTARPSTPPAVPQSPTKLVSPSKKKPRIPPAPALRPSLDAFWSPVVVNTWNDKHSPSKPLASPKKEAWLQSLDKQDLGLLSDSDASFTSPTTSPRKRNSGSPTKKDTTDCSPTVAQIRAQRKAFSEQKHSLAEAFLAELDATITGARISSLSRQTGGIKLLWSRTLKTTAGRANWRRETFRIKTGPLPTDFREEARHHCSIELAEKVIDDEERLYNVLAHEYCHLTTFMISEQRNNPHGAEFKAWGQKVSMAYGHKGVEVTTKHSYKIEYKYVWRCRECAYEFKRHSKSVDPERHSCGRCKGRLVQVKPVPRAAKTGDKGEKKENEYQVFIKANYQRIKKDMIDRGLETPMAKVTEAVAREYREKKERKATNMAREVDDVEAIFGGLKIEDE